MYISYLMSFRNVGDANTRYLPLINFDSFQACKKFQGTNVAKVQKLNLVILSKLYAHLKGGKHIRSFKKDQNEHNVLNEPVHEISNNVV